jgi:hypothetical protein
MLEQLARLKGRAEKETQRRATRSVMVANHERTQDDDATGHIFTHTNPSIWNAI